MTTAKLFYRLSFITEERFFVHQSDAYKYMLKLPLSMPHFSAKKVKLSPGGDIHMQICQIICAVATAPPGGGVDTRSVHVLKVL